MNSKNIKGNKSHCSTNRCSKSINTSACGSSKKAYAAKGEICAHERSTWVTVRGHIGVNPPTETDRPPRTRQGTQRDRALLKSTKASRMCCVTRRKVLSCKHRTRKSIVAENDDSVRRGKDE